MADIDVHNANRGEIIIYRAEDNTIQLDVRMENETVWLRQHDTTRCAHGE